MENVKGMMNKIEEIKQNFAEYLGEEYQYDYAILKAQDFGVPQNRERFILISNRMGVNPKDIFEAINAQKRTPFVLKFQQSLLNAGEEVNKALTSWQTAHQQLKVDNEQVSLLREASRKTEILMHNSSVNYIEVLTARQSLLAAEQKVAELHLDEIKSVILLYQALGGGKK